MKIENIRISTALFTLVALFILLTAVNSIISIYSLGKIKSDSYKLYHDRIYPLQHLKVVSDRMALDIVNTAYDMNHNGLDWNTGTTRIRKHLADIRTNWTAYLEIPATGKEKILKEEGEILFTGALGALEGLLMVARENDHETFNTFIEAQLYPNIDPFIGHVKKMMDIQLQLAGKVYHESEETYNQTVIELIIMVLVGLAIITGLSLFVIRTLNKSIKYTNEVVSEIADGNLEVEIKRTGKDEIGTLLGNMKKMLTKIREVVSHISTGASYVNRASHELNSAARQIAQGASEQASSIEEISASVEEMTANIQQNLMNAQRTEQISIKAADQITNVKDSSSNSSESITQIAEKISVIGSIAFQTHILALNAAIEAARAGKHGKGFGVVASEVGKLAERSKISAEEINKLATESVQITEEAKHLLIKIVPDIISTSQFVQEITASNNEQSIGADQINEGVQQLNQVTQQNAAASEELSSNADELAEMADRLMGMVSFFNIKTATDHHQQLQQIQ